MKDDLVHAPAETDQPRSGQLNAEPSNEHKSGNTPAPWTWQVVDHESLMLLGPDDDVACQSILWLVRCRACSAHDPENSRCGWPRKEDMPLIAASPALLATLLKAEDFILSNIMRAPSAVELLKEIKQVTSAAMTCPVPKLARRASPQREGDRPVSPPDGRSRETINRPVEEEGE